MNYLITEEQRQQLMRVVETTIFREVLEMLQSIEVRPDSIQFCHKHTWYGIVLMVRDTVPANGYGDFEWTRWRKANYVEYEIYMRRKTK